MRPSTTLARELGDPGALIDAAIAVNEAPTLAEAFQILAEAGLALLAADRIGVTLWDQRAEQGTIVAGAGFAVAEVGVTMPSSPAVVAALETGEVHVGPLFVAPAKVRSELDKLGTLVAVPMRLHSSRVIFHAGWSEQLEGDELESATTLLQTLTRLTTLAERSLRERQQTHLESVLEGVEDGVIMSSGDSVTANAAARAILGVPEGVVFHSSMFQPRTLEGEPFVIPADAPVGIAAARGESGRFKIGATSLDGRDVVVEGSVSPVPGGGAVIVFRDITAEHEREVLNEHYLYALFNSLPIPLTVGSAHDHTIYSVNEAFLELTGFERHEIENVQPPFPWWDPSEDSDAGFEPGSVVERVYRRKDGRPAAVEVQSHGIVGANGQVELLLGVITDLTEKRRLDQQLVQSGKLAAIGELAAGVAHEINNPLFAILGLTEFLLKESEPGTKARQRLELIQQTGLEIKEIVRALLDFARENAEERHVVPLEDVIRQTVDLVRRTNAHKGVELVDSYDDSGATVHGSPNQLKQIFLNLIANARQAMPNGGTVYVEVRRQGDNVLASVRDDGPGIEPQVLERIFEPFFTTKRVSGGTGLGLSVSLGIAEAHGGSLTASSEIGRGSTFTLLLPVTTVEEVE